MIKVNKEIKEKGILVESGFGDIKIHIRESILISIKSILINCNKTLKKLLEDEKFCGILELYKECSEIGFLEIEKYYSGGEMLLRKENVCDILMFCVCYKDEEIYEYCLDFIKDKIDDDILIRLIEINNIFPNSLSEIEELITVEYENRGYKYLYNNDYLKILDINNVNILLSLKNIIIRNETWLLNELLEWYKYKMNNQNDDNIDLTNEFKYLLKEHINNEMINENEIKSENKEVLKSLKMKFNKKKSINYIDLKEIKDENIQDVIIDNYYENEKVEFTDVEKEKLNKMKEDELSDIIMSLVKIDDVKLTEIVMMIIIYKNVKFENYISNIEKRKMISKLCCEYNENKRNRSLKCLCLFIDDKKNVITIENLCGKEILYEIINNEYNLNSNSKELLVKYVEELQTKEINSFSYPYSKYLFEINREISLIPSFDGEECEFSSNPSLPDGIILDKESGIIHGKVKNTLKFEKYEIICKNDKSEKKFKILLKFVDIKFTKKNSSNGMIISNDGKILTKTNDGFNHCYLNIKTENGISHIKFKYYQNGASNDDIFLGLSTDNSYSGVNIHNQITTCNYCACDGKSIDITRYCHIGTIVNSNPYFNNHGDSSIYEIIVDMNKKEFWICHNNSPPVLLVKDLPSPLYPYVSVYDFNSSIELLSVLKHN